jgi:hypothetical protein
VAGRAVETLEDLLGAKQYPAVRAIVPTEERRQLPDKPVGPSLWHGGVSEHRAFRQPGPSLIVPIVSFGGDLTRERRNTDADHTQDEKGDDCSAHTPFTTAHPLSGHPWLLKKTLTSGSASSA